ncbi:Scopoletin glucosyltransferase [Bienertia sinuspersici]
MGEKAQSLHIVLFPLMAAGHMIPTLDIAKLLTSRNFPSKKAGLPEGVENFDQLISQEMSVKFLKAMELLQESLENFIEKLVFEGINYFAACVAHSMYKYKPQELISSNNDEDEFVVPHLPHEIKLMRSQLPEFAADEGNNEWEKILDRAYKAEENNFGAIMNSFYELEKDYADYYRNVLGKRAWEIGPVSLCNRENEAKFQRGNKSCSIDEHECLKWLDSKKPNSVIYLCFGSMVQVATSQLHEIALGLEASEHDFIWVVKSNTCGEWLPQGFEKRVEEKGLIIRGWAPQVLILDHYAIGAFVTHCGWNSILEAISSGTPMVTWPAFAEQFYNEKLVVQILNIGIAVGAKRWTRILEFDVTRKDLEVAIRRVMVGPEALEIRCRVKKIKEMAKKAIEIGGSSHCNLDSLLHELTIHNEGKR